MKLSSGFRLFEESFITNYRLDYSPRKSVYVDPEVENATYTAGFEPENVILLLTILSTS